MRKFTVKGPGRSCDEIVASSLDEALAKARSRHPGKEVAADATEVIYVCDSREDLEACRARLQ
ncbi:hypothetical protein ACP3TJ_01055 [Desulforudis sp. 1088]|uniref:hypothetical protein n=1 Tax=unclassified Candidatus Desulforudis TaxID=2635950 RepID=UPI003484FBD0